MRAFGILLCLGAVLALIFGYIYDTSVSTELGGRVHNIGLMNDKQNIIIVGGALLVAGALLLALSTRSASQISPGTAGYRQCPSCAEMDKNEATVCRYCQRDLPSLGELQAKEEAAKQKLTELQALKVQAARQAEELLPKGTCPNCNGTIALTSLECKHCRANFEPGSAWRVLPAGDT